MIELIPVNHPTKLNSDVKQIYEVSFTTDERRDWSQLTDLLQNEQFSLNEIYFSHQLIGLISFWKLNQFIFVEHFAIRDSEQSKGYGTLVINQLLQKISVPVILEVEKPVSESAQKRIRFYERLNFKTCSGDYFQPPYSAKKNKVEMLLICYPNEISQEEFDLVVSEIHRWVYQFFEYFTTKIHQ